MVEVYGIEGDLVTTPSMVLEHTRNGYRVAGEFSPWLGETLVVMRQGENSED
jgi:hypothetical protein